nr:hypothetical protein asmbl_25 [uncultured bacterium]
MSRLTIIIRRVIASSPRRTGFPREHAGCQRLGRRSPAVQNAFTTANAAWRA